MLKAENLTLYVNDNGSRKCLLNDISFHVDDGGDVSDYRTKWWWKIYVGENIDRN